MGKQLTNEEFQKRLSQIGTDVCTDDVYKTSKDFMTFYCSKGHTWPAQASNVLYRHSGCPYCSGNLPIVGETDLWTVRPDIAQLLKNPNDGYSCTAQSNQSLIFVCPECKREQTKIIRNIYHQGFSCQFCGDGISYPNKFLKSMLTQLGVDADYEWQPKWLKPYFYDSHFVINDNHYVIEMDGKLGHGNFTFGNNIDVDGLLTDQIKDDLAAKYGVIVIRIDCVYQSINDRFAYIKNSITHSDVRTLFDLSLVDWDLCNKSGLSSSIITAANMYMNGKTVGEISSALKHDRHTITVWLKTATDIGRCDYNQYESRRRSKSKDRGYEINRYTIDGVFIDRYMSSREIERRIGFPSSSVCAALQRESHKYKDFLWFKADDLTQPDKSKIIFNDTKLIKEAI